MSDENEWVLPIVTTREADLRTRLAAAEARASQAEQALANYDTLGREAIKVIDKLGWELGFAQQALADARARIGVLEGALTPSAETKAAYIGEFTHTVTYFTDDGRAFTMPVWVPWPTIKEIMKAIRAHAALEPKP